MAQKAQRTWPCATSQWGHNGSQAHPSRTSHPYQLAQLTTLHQRVTTLATFAICQVVCLTVSINLEISNSPFFPLVIDTHTLCSSVLFRNNLQTRIICTHSVQGYDFIQVCAVKSLPQQVSRVYHGIINFVSRIWSLTGILCLKWQLTISDPWHSTWQWLFYFLFLWVKFTELPNWRLWSIYFSVAGLFPFIHCPLGLPATYHGSVLMQKPVTFHTVCVLHWSSPVHCWLVLSCHMVSHHTYNLNECLPISLAS